MDPLFERAHAAIVESRKLALENRTAQASIHAKIKQFAFEATLYPKSLKLFSPLDFPVLNRPYRPFPKNDYS
jgi:hypothetical protein